MKFSGLLLKLQAGVSPVRLARRGFSLIELMITLGVIAVLMSVALPIYTSNVTQSRIMDATSNLATWQVKMEQWFQDNLSYYAVGSTTTCGGGTPASSNYFTFTCNASSATAYVLTATGTGSMAGFTYTVDQNGTRGSSITVTGWAATSSTCWIIDKGGRC